MEHEETRRELEAAEDKAKRVSEKLAKETAKADDANAKGKGHERAAAERRTEVEELKKERDEYKAQRTLAEATLHEERHVWQVRSLWARNRARASAIDLYSARCKRLRIVTSGVSGGKSLTGAVSRRPPVPLDTMYYPVPRATRTKRVFGVCPSSKGHSVSRRAQKNFRPWTSSLGQPRLAVENSNTVRLI